MHKLKCAFGASSERGVEMLGFFMLSITCQDFKNFGNFEVNEFL